MTTPEAPEDANVTTSVAVSPDGVKLAGKIVGADAPLLPVPLPEDAPDDVPLLPAPLLIVTGGGGGVGAGGTGVGCGGGT
jgi:hypothetical protein